MKWVLLLKKSYHKKIFIENKIINLMKKRLNYLAIPGGSNKELKKVRKKRAIKAINNRLVDQVLILQGKDSEEDILYLGKVVQKGDRVGFDTFPLHYKEYKVLIKKAIRDKKFPKGVKTENLKIPQTARMEIYGLLGLSEELLKKRELDYKKNRPKNPFLKGIKRIGHKIVRIN